MGLRKTYKTDRTLEIEGVWMDVSMNDHNDKPIRIKVARMSDTNKRYTKALDKASRPHQSAIQNNALDNEIARRMLQAVFVETILLDWDNLPKSELTGNDNDSELLEFSRENVEALFTELPEVFDDWEKRARSAAAFREAEKEAAAGN